MPWIIKGEWPGPDEEDKYELWNDVDGVKLDDGTAEEMRTAYLALPRSTQDELFIEHTGSGRQFAFNYNREPNGWNEM